MSRKTFLTFAALIALSVGAFALFMPAALLESKGVAPSAAADVWVREVGVLLVAAGVTSLLVRDHSDSPTLRAILIGNGLVQVGLFPIEIAAYHEGVITNVSGIAPNSALHVLLAAGFVYFAARIKVSACTPA